MRPHSRQRLIPDKNTDNSWNSRKNAHLYRGERSGTDNFQHIIIFWVQNIRHLYYTCWIVSSKNFYAQNKSLILFDWRQTCGKRQNKRHFKWSFDFWQWNECGNYISRMVVVMNLLPGIIFSYMLLKRNSMISRAIWRNIHSSKFFKALLLTLYSQTIQ
jgi:hypothetical protein